MVLRMHQVLKVCDGSFDGSSDVIDALVIVFFGFG